MWLLAVVLVLLMLLSNVGWVRVEVMGEQLVLLVLVLVVLLRVGVLLRVRGVLLLMVLLILLGGEVRVRTNVMRGRLLVLALVLVVLPERNWGRPGG